MVFIFGEKRTLFSPGSFCLNNRLLQGWGKGSATPTLKDRGEDECHAHSRGQRSRMLALGRERKLCKTTVITGCDDGCECDLCVPGCLLSLLSSQLQSHLPPCLPLLKSSPLLAGGKGCFSCSLTLYSRLFVSPVSSTQAHVPSSLCSAPLLCGPSQHSCGP